ncbi:MAG: ABC transporter substrate-binding protein [Anaerolineales bacterium]
MNKTVRYSLLIFPLILILSACNPTAAKPAPDTISVRLKWTHGVQFAGLYMAEQQGFFEEENLSVTLLEGGLDFDEIDLVATGQNDFGIVGGPQVLVARGQDIPIKAVATIFRIDPAVYFALTESGIEGPEDFIGKRVIVNPVDAKMSVMLKNAGIDMAQIIEVPPSSDIEIFYNREVDVWGGYITNQVVRARLDGYELNVIFPSDYGVHYYGDCFITTERLLQENPDLVERFLRAAIRGWRYAIENPDEAVAATLKYFETDDEAFLKASMEAQIPLIHTGVDQIGWMKAKIWQGMYDILLEQGTLVSSFDLDQIYTMDILNRIYGK